MKRNSPFAMHRSPRKEISSYDYIFEDDDLEQVPMSTKPQDFLEKEVMPDDTLQSIALEFNVQIADLKRINNIHKDNEIFARKIIKIPHKPYSLLLESKFGRDKNDVKDIADDPLLSSPSHDEAKVLVDIVNNSKSSPLLTLSSPSSPDIEDQDEGETDVLLRVMPSSPDITTLNCKCADSDISPRFLLFVVVLLGLGGPAAYVWYFWTHVETSS